MCIYILTDIVIDYLIYSSIYSTFGLFFLITMIMEITTAMSNNIIKIIVIICPIV
jgi:hypothetical protein